MMRVPEKIVITPDPALADSRPPDGVSFDCLYDKEKERDGEGAIVIARLDDLPAFSTWARGGFNRLRDAIKKPGEMDHVMPDVWGQFAEAIRKIAAYEARHSRLMLYKTAQLTLRQWEMNPGQTQVGNDWHTDGGEPDKVENPFVEHVYTVSDVSPTLLQARTMTDAFNQLSHARGPEENLVVQARPGDINLMTNYCWHSTAAVTEPCVRTFLRITYESPSLTVLKALPARERRALGLKF